MIEKRTTFDIYYHDCPWESDFILKHIFGDCEYNLYKFDSFKQLQSVTNHKTWLHKPPQSKSVLVFSSQIQTIDITLKQVLEFVYRYNPDVIINCSDEWCEPDGSGAAFDELSQYTSLYMRQYRHLTSNVPYNNDSDINIIPLGYASKIFKYVDGKPVTRFKHVKDKRYKWAFIGNVKHDREALVNCFKEVFPDPNDYFVSDNIYGNKLQEIYNDSIFTLSPPGNRNVDCFRLYESIQSGSIPIIVCPDIQYYMHMLDKLSLPLLHIQDYKKAAELCKQLINYTDALNSYNIELYNAWELLVTGIRTKIFKVLFRS